MFRLCDIYNTNIHSMDFGKVPWKFVFLLVMSKQRFTRHEHSPDYITGEFTSSLSVG
ncbi:hypothetical protein HmCmsJML160_02912 [Escherichia coli]|nr:hypothetical protein HmCmsJML050_01603 [Escherichia coli]GCX22457.1 hypothetical protein HmCmsJML082_04462 [Escherichia coli]GCZ34559.1 hypothetical protein HmCmsJML160_02912 [Escherichia coli]